MRWGNIRKEMDRLPVDPDVDQAPTPHPWVLVRANADLIPVIAAGGALGSLARWGLAKGLPHGTSAFAWSTAITNVAGAFLLGVLMAFMLDHWSHTRYLRPLLGVGILGGFTTFSTFMLDVRGETAAHHLPVAAAYVLVSVIGGLIAVAAGLLGTRAVVDRGRA